MAQDAIGVRLTDHLNVDAAKILTGTTKTLAVTIHDGTDLANVTAAGALQVDGSAVTQPVSGTVTANQGGAPWSQNLIQVNGTTQTGRDWSVDFLKLNVAIKAEDSAFADLDTGIGALAVRKAAPANTSSADGDYEFLQMSAGRLWTSATIDSALPAGTNTVGKVDQGVAAATNASPWWVRVTDGTDNLKLIQTGDTVVGATDTGITVLGTDGTNYRTLAVDASGNQKVVGNVASGSADSGNPVKVGAVFNAVAPTFLTGQRGDLQLDASANLKTYMASWFGSTAPTVGQKAMVSSIPVVLASNQSPIPVTFSGAVGAEKTNEQPFSALGAQSTTGNLDFPAVGGTGGTTAKLTQLVVSSEAPGKAQLFTSIAGVDTVIKTFYFEAGVPVVWSPPNEDYHTIASGVLNFWRVKVTNNNPTGFGPAESGAVSVYWTEV